MSPQEPKWTTTQLVTAGVITAAVGAALVAGALAISSAGGDEDERPPIIVSNGSVEFDISDHPNGKGLWKGSDKTYRHEHPKFKVVTLQMDTDPKKQAVCATKDGSTTSLKPPFTGPTVEIKYGKETDGSGSWETTTASIDADGYLKLVFGQAPVLSESDTRLTRFLKSDGNNIRQVTVGNYVCTFDKAHGQAGGTRVKIYQLK